MKKVAGRLRLELSQYRELEAFSQFGSELDPADPADAGARRAHGRDAQPATVQPWPMEEQVVAIYAGINGFLDDVPVADISRFQDELREYLRTEGALYKEIRETGDLPDDVAERLDKELEKFKQSFNPSQEPRSPEPPPSRWPRFRTSSAASARSATRGRSRARWSSSRRPS